MRGRYVLFRKDIFTNIVRHSLNILTNKKHLQIILPENITLHMNYDYYIYRKIHYTSG